MKWDLSKFKECAKHGHHAGNECPLCKNETHAHTQLPDPKPSKQKRALDTNHEGETPSAGCPFVRFTLCRVRLLDVDAKYGSVKDLLDGVAIAGLIPGDREGQITLEVRQEKVRSFKDEKTVIEIFYEMHKAF